MKPSAASEERRNQATQSGEQVEGNIKGHKCISNQTWKLNLRLDKEEPLKSIMTTGAFWSFSESRLVSFFALPPSFTPPPPLYAPWLVGLCVYVCRVFSYVSSEADANAFSQTECVQGHRGRMETVNVLHLQEDLYLKEDQHEWKSSHKGRNYNNNILVFWLANNYQVH